MQLKKSKGRITGVLATATCSLLSQSSVAQEIPGWYVDSAIMSYSEKDRVDAVEPVISLTRVFDNGQKLSLKYALDSLTGASPNGALPSTQIQTFTRPSGLGSYITEPGDFPLDDTFKDSRSALSAQYEFPLNRMTRISTGLAYSDEYDYTSMGFNLSLARDFNNKNTTVTAGIAYANDSIEPEGGVPIPLASAFYTNPQQPRQGSDDDKTVTDFLLGVTQVINRKTLMQLNYSFSSSDGYLTDPFKILTLADAASGLPVDYLYENRPDTRDKHSVYWKTKYSLDNGNVIDLSYRYLWDDWDITSHTVDFRYRYDFNDKFYVQPHLRYYDQSAAEFYSHSLTAGAILPEFATADPRLGQFTGMTYGAKFGYRIGSRSEISLRLEMYDQTGDTIGNPIGIQNNFDLYPDLEATIIQLGYSIRF